MKKNRQKMTHNTAPEGITVSMALTDLLHVLFFGGTGILLGAVLGSLYAVFFAFLVFLSGLLKVLWKLIAALTGKNVWWLFVQMRLVMPIAFTGMMAACIVSLLRTDHAGLLSRFTAMPQLLFFLLGIAGLVMMIVCAAKLDSSDPKANWLEQGINSAAQGLIFLGMLFAWLA